MTISTFLLIATYSYLMGSVPFGYILVRIFRGQDVRQTGSGNIGATNVSRTSPLLGIVTLLLDACKGLAAVLLARHLFPGNPMLMGAAAFFAIAGHMYPVWLRFRGGKGVATGLGSFAVIAPRTVLLTIAVFAVIFLAFRYVSLASLAAVALFPLFAWRFESLRDSPQLLIAIAAASLLIIAKHRDNLRRLLSHNEPRFQWGRR